MRSYFIRLLSLVLLCLLTGQAWAVTNTWSPAASLTTARQYHTATLLPSGQVLVVAGLYSNNYLASAELYDPATNTWRPAAPLATARQYHTATLLPSGQVLVAGGGSDSGTLASAELYDPATNTWSPAAPLSNARYGHTATLLPSGQVLVAGGNNSSGTLASAELYDPATNTWSTAAPLGTARGYHTATLLASGHVLVAGGYNGSWLASAQRYDPATNTWSAAGSLTTARQTHTATLLPSGQVLVVGGLNSSALASAERYDPETNTWSAAGSLATARQTHTATLLPSGQVLVAGGQGNTGTLASAERYTPATNTWSAAGSLTTARRIHTATLLPSGQVLVAGGLNSSSSLASAERYDPAANTWSAAASLTTVIYNHTATLLPSGQVLVAGGIIDGDTYPSPERYNPATNTWSAAAPLATLRYLHTATLLPSGQVLVVGGRNNSNVASAERYDPATNTWSPAGSLATARYGHTATLLSSGQVLVAGGRGSGGGNGSPLASAELYDPATNSWSPAGPLFQSRYDQTATLLPSGKVLVAGGNFGGGLAGAELYNPATNTWSAAASLAVARSQHTATLLPSGQVLVAGGRNGDGILTSAERYDPATNTWSAAASLAVARHSHTATLLSSGQVLVVAGGNFDVSYLASAQLYDPATNTWSAAASLATGRRIHQTTLLPSGQVLVVGGSILNGYLASAELYDPGLAPVTALRPVLSAANAFLLQTSALVATSPGSTTSANAVTATGLMPRREASGGSTNNSASNAPMFQVQRLDSDQMRFVRNDGAVNMTDTAFTGSASALAGFPAGPVLVRVWVNGVPSASRYSTLAVTPGRPLAASATGGALQATVTFNAAADTGGAPVTNYTATASPGGATATCTAPCTSIVVSPLAAGSYTFTVHATNAAGNGPNASASATVTAATPVIAWTPTSPITYGTPLGATQLNATASYNGNPVVGTFTYTPTLGEVLPAGNGQTLSLTFMPTDTASYVSATEAATIDVKPKPLQVTGTSAQNKPYDGTTTATLSGGTLVGVIAADAGNVTLAQAGAFAQANVGMSIGMTANDSIGGSAAGNYMLIQPTGLQADITPATLTYTATPTTVPYGTTPSGLGGTLSGFVSSESQATATTGTLVFTTTANASSEVGQYPITGGGLSANNGNYVFVQAAGNATALTVERAEQATLNLVATPDVLIPGMTSQLATSGGSGSGSISYVVTSGPCSVSGSITTATGVGACVVRATKASDTNYNAASVTKTITVQAPDPLVAQAQSVGVILNTAQAIQLAGSDGSIGGPYALIYAIARAPAHGTISGLGASTGALTYTPANGYIGADDFTFTVASANGISQAATVTIAVAVPPLALLVGDARNYARYGQVVDYVATLTNASVTAQALPVTFTLSAGFDPDSLQLACVVPGGDAECSQDSTDPLRFTVTLLPGRTLAWLANARVRPDATDDTVTFGVDAVGASGVTDTNTLVIFRDGFDVSGSDGTRADPVVEGAQARAILYADDVIDVVVPTSIGAVPAPLLILRDASREIRIESRNVADIVLVRLFERTADRERVSAWSATQPGATLTLGSVALDPSTANDAATPRAVVLSGAESMVALP